MAWGENMQRNMQNPPPFHAENNPAMMHNIIKDLLMKGYAKFLLQLMQKIIQHFNIKTTKSKLISETTLIKGSLMQNK